MDTISRKEYSKAWYEKNKEKHLQNMKEKMMCELCNVEIAKSKYSIHKKTQKHQLNEKNKQMIEEIERHKEEELKNKTMTNILDSLAIIDKNGAITKITDLLK